MQLGVFSIAGLGQLLLGEDDSSFFVQESWYGGGHGEQAGPDLIAQWDREKADALKFLAENGKKPAVITTASGLQYQVLKQGKGPQPGPTDIISVNYLGKFIDDTPFVSYFENGPAAKYHVDQVSIGWKEAVQQMHEGDRWRVWIPPKLAKGANGEMPLTVFNKFQSMMDLSVLIYDIDLQRVEHPIR